MFGQEVRQVAEGMLLSIQEVGKQLGLGRDRAYELIRSGRIRSVKVGARLLVPRQELEAWVARELQGLAK
jgi:excisionase family DNA binding protein